MTQIQLHSDLHELFYPLARTHSYSWYISLLKLLLMHSFIADYPALVSPLQLQQITRGHQFPISAVEPAHAVTWMQVDPNYVFPTTKSK